VDLYEDGTKSWGIVKSGIFD